jgi:hypothetical protein
VDHETRFYPVQVVHVAVPLDLLHRVAVDRERRMDWKNKVLLIGALLAAAAFVWLQFFGAEQPM